MKRETIGLWWLPIRPEHRVYGILRHELGNMPELEVFFVGMPADFIVENHGIVHGLSKSNQKISLLMTSERQCNWSAAGSASGVSKIFQCRLAVLGAQIDEPHAFKLNWMRVEIQQLFGWFFKDEGVSISRDSKPALQLPFNNQSAGPFEIGSDIQMYIRTLPMFQAFEESGGGGGKVVHRAVVDFSSETGIGFDVQSNLVSDFRSFLTLVTLRPVFAASTSGVVGDGMEPPGAYEFSDPIAIWDSNHRANISESGFGDNWLFRYSDVAGHFAEVSRRWFELKRTMPEVIDCYTSTLYKRLSPEIENLSLTQALEAFDGHENESFKQRGLAKKLVRLIQPNMSILGAHIRNPEEFAKVVADTRNYFAHRNPEDRINRIIAEGSDLVRYNQFLAILIRLIVLRKIGVPEEFLKGATRVIFSHVYTFSF